MTPDEYQKYRNLGLKSLAEGKIGLVLLAGGQATRLQMSDVKGNVDFGLPSRMRLLFIILHRQLSL